jgi:multidrug efflux pump subunit AcrA (membrane-fusion protein)
MQQHRDAMWTAAYNAAAGVGLNAATAAACADAAVQSTTEAADAAAAAAARSQQQQQLAMQQLIAAQQQQQQQLAHQLAAVTAPMGTGLSGMTGSQLNMQQLQHAGSFGMFGGMQSGSPVPHLNKLGSPGCLELEQQQLMLQQAGALAMHCDAFSGSKQLGGLINQAQAGMGPLQVSVTAGCGAAFGGL